MPRVNTKFFGEVDYNPDSVFLFPSGLPGFDQEREFLFLKVPASDPVMFLQSISMRSLCFVLVPILTLAPNFPLSLTAEELLAIGFDRGCEPVIGKDVLCAALVCAGAGSLSANLMAPIVVNLANRTGIQAIHPETGYSHRHPITLEEPALVC